MHPYTVNRFEMTAVSTEIADLVADGVTHFVVFKRAEVDAEIARVKNELDAAMKLAGHCGPALHAKIQECDLLKAALRWSLKNGVCSAHRFLWMNPTRFDTTIDPPPEFAPLIAEAAGSRREEES